MPKNDASTTNSSPYLYPWTPSYWKAAIQQTKDFKVMVTVAMLIALNVVLTIFVDIPIPLGDNTLRIRFDFLAEIVFCMIGGPIIGVAGGMAGDLVSYLCHKTFLPWLYPICYDCMFDLFPVFSAPGLPLLKSRSASC